MEKKPNNRRRTSDSELNFNNHKIMDRLCVDAYQGVILVRIKIRNALRFRWDYALQETNEWFAN
jgi:hypothetical protein